MAKAKFQGQAIGKGFSNIDPGFAALTRLKDKQDQDLANLKQAEKDRRDRDLQAEDHLERVMRAEEANRKDIYIEDKVFSTRERALQTNREIFVQNEKAKIKSIEAQNDNLQKLIGFSKSAFESYQTIKKKDWDATMDASYNYYMTHGMTIEDQLRVEMLEDRQWAQGEDLERVADELKREGYTPEEVMWVRHKNSASDYGRLKAYSVMAGNKFGAWAASKLAEMDANTPEEKQAALEILQIRYLRAHKLYGLSSDFLGPMFSKMSGARDRILNKATIDQAVQQSQERTREKVEVLVSNFQPGSDPTLTAQGILGVHSAYTREYKSNGIDTFDDAEARDKTIELFKEEGLFSIDSNQIRVAFKKTPYADQNTNWYDANKFKIEEMIKEREFNIKEIKKSADLERKALRKQELDAAERYLNPTDEDRKAGKGWNRDVKVAQDVISKLLANGHDYGEVMDRFGGYLDESVQRQNKKDWWETYFLQKHKEHRLTIKDWEDPNLPHSIRDDVDLKREVFEKETIKGRGAYADNWQGRFEKALKNSIKINDLKKGGVIDESYEPALYDAETQYYTCLFDDKRGDPTACGKEVIKDIKTEEGTFSIKKRDGTGQAYFDQYSYDVKTPEEHPEQFITLNQNELTAARDMIDDDPSLLYSQLFISTDQIKEIETAIINGKDFKYPKILTEITSMTDMHGHVSNLFKVQVELAKEKGLLEENKIDFKALEPAWFRDVVDPEAVNLMKNLQTKADGRKLLQQLLNPNSTRDFKFMDEGVVKALIPRTEPPTTQEMKDDDAYEYLINPNPYIQGQYAQYTGGE